MPSFASIMANTTLDFSIACNDLMILNFSITSFTFPFRRTPAVSTNKYFLSSRSKGTETLSLVVPGWSKTTNLSSPINRFIKVDLPTFGLPMKAIFKAFLSVFTCSSPSLCSESFSNGANISSINAETRSP